MIVLVEITFSVKWKLCLSGLEAWRRWRHSTIHTSRPSLKRPRDNKVVLVIESTQNSESRMRTRVFVFTFVEGFSVIYIWNARGHDR